MGSWRLPCRSAPAGPRSSAHAGACVAVDHQLDGGVADADGTTVLVKLLQHAARVRLGAQVDVSAQQRDACRVGRGG